MSESMSEFSWKTTAVPNKKFTLEEKREISRNILLKRIEVQVRKDEDNFLTNKMGKFATEVIVATAYSDNYSIGTLCESVNRSYCNQHGYQFECVTLSQEQMMNEIKPRQHCTWYKVKLINHLLSKYINISNEINENSTTLIKYIFWIDSDAIFINHMTKIESFIHRGRFKNLIIAEDMNQACLVNAGVMLIQINDWNIQFWKDVWDCYHYFNIPYYDQSAIIKILKARQEGLHLVQPFHSYVPGGPVGDKHFPNVVVLPHLDFNTNYGYVNANNRKVLRKFNRTKQKLYLKEKRFNLQKNCIQSNTQDNNTYATIPPIQTVKSTTFCDDENTTISKVSNSETTSLYPIETNQICELEKNTFIEKQVKENKKECIVTTATTSTTNDIQTKVENEVKMIKSETKTDLCAKLEEKEEGEKDEEAKFIFHAAGRCDKLISLNYMISKYSIELTHSNNESNI